MWFTNKKGILERCGKNEKDVRWLDRAIKKWKVIHDLDMGYITSVDYIEELELRVEDLKRWKKSEVVERVDSKEIDELKECLGYVWGRYDMAKKSVMFVIDSYCKSDSSKREEMKKRVGYKDDSREDIERAWATENWII